MMENRLPVSVIIPCYNCAATIERAVASIAKQTKKPTELILIDDQSSDDTWEKLEIIKDYYSNMFNICIIQNEVNVGAGDARNVGWNNANCEYICFLDADDAWLTKKLEVQYNLMLDNNADMSCHYVGIVSNEIGGVSKIRNKCYNVNKIIALFKNPVMTPSVMLKRNIDIRFKRGKRYSEDCWLWNHILWMNKKVIFINECLAYVYKPYYGQSGLGNNMWKMEKGELGNFFDLAKKGKVPVMLCIVAALFSIIKFLRRKLIVKYNNVIHMVMI